MLARLLKGTRSSYAELEFDFEECYKALSEKLDWESPEGGDYPFDLSKPLPLITRKNRQRVPFEFFINNDLKYLQGGISTMTYTTSTTKTKAAQYDLPGIEDMVLNIWSPVKVAYDKGDVYSTKRILVVTHVSVMRKHEYGYLEEIVVRRADNVLYKFKEGDFPRLRINDIEDMLLLVVQNWLTNLSGDDVADFTIALRMFTRSLPDTTRPDLRKRHPYTLYKDPQGFIYVDDHKKNRLIRSDELYKFSDGTLTRLLSSLEDITKNIDMEYLPKRRWSNLEKNKQKALSVGYNLKNWSEKLDDALWAFRTAYKTPTGCTPFRLVYRKACHLPVEIKHKAYWALKQCNMDLATAVKNCFMELNELIELRDGAYKNTHIYKERNKKWHDSRLRGDKNFKVGDKVLLFNSRFKMHPGKLKSKWYGPNVVKTVYPYGTIEITNKNGISFKVNGQRLKKYYDGNIDTYEREDLAAKKSTMLVKYLQSGILAH
ncbi:integrase, catalytic region, zinc finger, CCHC-type containing protein [Tanacetum coccineum]